MARNSSAPKLTIRQQEEKSHSIAVQERINAEGAERFEQRNRDELGKLKEDVARGLLKGGLTWQQSLDLPRRVFAGSRNYRHGIDPPFFEGKMARRRRLEIEEAEKLTSNA